MIVYVEANVRSEFNCLNWNKIRKPFIRDIITAKSGKEIFSRNITVLQKPLDYQMPGTSR